MRINSKTKAIMTVFILIVLIAVFSGIALKIFHKEDAVLTGVNLYFIDMDSSTLQKEERMIAGEEQYEIVVNTIEELKKGPKTEGYLKSVPDNVKIKEIEIEKDMVKIDMSKEYNDMKQGEELLCRGALVWTLTELDFIQSVTLTVDGVELTKTSGEPIGAMKREDIVISGEISPELTNYKTVKLYFATENADGLKAEERTIEVNSNHPLEWYVMEQLIEGPNEKGLYATVPSETKIRDISTVDGVCYVDLSEEFVTKHNGGSTGEMLTVYSIVDSLTELENITKVQFLIEGKKVEEYKGHLDFSKPFEAVDFESE